MKPTNRIAVALGLEDTDSTLTELHRLRDKIAMAEVRLDLMSDFNLERLITRSPCPLVITCRPVREGGKFTGSEATRLSVLHDACSLNCAYVDIEWDSIQQFNNPGDSTKIIVSRHFYDTMPGDFTDLYNVMREQADVVKLVGFAPRITQTLPVLDLMASARTPLIAIAMGPFGLITRLLAPCFTTCLLTYAATDAAKSTAPGQISVQSMIDQYCVHQVHDETEIHIYFCADAAQLSQVASKYPSSSDHIHIPVEVSPDEAGNLAHELEQLTPRLHVVDFTTDSPSAQ